MKYDLFILSLLLLFNLSCKKDKTDASAIKTKIESALFVDSLSANSACIKLKLTDNNIKEAGIIYSNNSSNVDFNNKNAIIVKANIIQNNNYYTSLTNLSPNIKYSFSIFIKYSNNSVVYSDSIYSFTTKNCNLYWDSSTRLVIKSGGIDMRGNSMVDTMSSNYNATINNNKSPISLIIGGSDYLIRFSIPKEVPLGRNEFMIKYKGIKIFETTIDVLKGSFFI